MLQPTKYRPQRFADIVGQKNQLHVKVLQASARKRRPMAAILLGRIGVAKTSMARLLQASYNCLDCNPKTADPCWSCDHCLKCKPEYNGEWLTYWTYEIDATQKLDREALSEILEQAREASPFIPTALFVDELSRLDEATAQPVFLKFVEDLKNGVFLAAAMTDEGRTFKGLKIHPALFGRLEKYDFCTPEVNEQVELLQRLLPQWEISSDEDTLRQLVLQTNSSFRECLQKLEMAQNINNGKMDRHFLERFMPASQPSICTSSDPYANDPE